MFCRYDKEDIPEGQSGSLVFEMSIKKEIDTESWDIDNVSEGDSPLPRGVLTLSVILPHGPS